MRNLRNLYTNGRGVLKDETKATEWYRKAAEKGHVRAMYDLGILSQDGRGGLAKNDAEAARWVRKAADQSEPAAMNSLGWYYENGRGVEKDLAQARQWYIKAAEAG